MLELLQDNKCEFAFSAEVQGKLAAVLFGWKSRFHPHCTYIKTVSDPELADDESLSSLLAEADRYEALSYPLQTSIWETAPGLKSVYTGNGFTEIRRTYMPELLLSHVPLEEPPEKRLDGQAVQSIAELSEDARMQVVSLAKRIYEETHQVNPPADRSVSEWEQVVFAEDTIEDGSFVWMDTKADEIIAYSFLHTSEKVGAYELGWCGYIKEADPSILSELVRHQLYYAAIHHIHTLIGEFDTTDPYATEVLKRFPFAPCATLITYQKKVVPLKVFE
ncbi:hypothetical protein NCCP2716_11490 [Sporosarcina sp. NCCP-2716]|nr:hypothetical protein NCCP2716_11490 [Sporosarcina sp. NCCP-2716]